MGEAVRRPSCGSVLYGLVSMGGNGFGSQTKHNRLPFRGGSTPKAKPDDHRSCRAGFQSPSFRGGSTPAGIGHRPAVRRISFQSPSFRGGSTPGRGNHDRARAGVWFQSPSFRGGSTPVFWRICHLWHQWMCFNPLRFGAGALPLHLGARSRVVMVLFQSPSFRGGSTPASWRVRSVLGTIWNGFQSPSFRGGSTPVVFVFLAFAGVTMADRFNPLRFGAGALPRS